MGFLDNLESSLKSLEGNNEKEVAGQDRQRQRDAKAEALAAAPYAEALKTSAFINDLLMNTVRIGHSMRVKVNMNWAGSTLRLEARAYRLELRPTPEGIEAGFFPPGAPQPVSTRRVDLKSDSQLLAQYWMDQVRESIEPVVPDEE